MKLDVRISEMIAIGASVGAHCQPCLKYHVEKARENGVSMEEIAGAIEVGKMIGRGAGNEMAKFSAGLLNNSEHQTNKEEAKASSEGCSCGCNAD